MMVQSVPPVLAEFPYTHAIEVRFRDIDLLGHVNNAVYASYFEMGRIMYYQVLTGLPFHTFNSIVAEVTIRYKAPALFGDELVVGTRVSSFGTKSFVMDYALARVADNKLIATASSTLVSYDYNAKKSVAITEEFKQQVMDFQAKHAGGSALE